MPCFHLFLIVCSCATYDTEIQASAKSENTINHWANIWANWLGAVNLSNDVKSERYMNPPTIMEILSKHPLYQ